MFDYYFELLNKPKYMLSESETMFLDVFPWIVIGVVCFIALIIWIIVDSLKGDKK